MFKNKLRKRHHKMDQPGFKKRLCQICFKVPGHFEGSDFQPFVILARVPVDFKVVFGRLFSDIWKWSKMVENGSASSSERSMSCKETAQRSPAQLTDLGRDIGSCHALIINENGEICQQWPAQPWQRMSPSPCPNLTCSGCRQLVSATGVDNGGRQRMSTTDVDH